MKTTKRIAFILAVVMIIAVFPTYGVSAAAIGDKLGNVLNSDIKVFINDNRIPSYNINNKTVIVAEDLKNYGFDVQWNATNRSLAITLSPGKKATPIKAEDNTKTPGTPAFPYVYTDIVATVEGKKVESYNVQGKTVIFFADLAVYGTMKWDGTKRHSMLYTNSYTPTYKVGDVLGSVLNSNIKAFINDNRIPSYNIANKTVILAEDLKNYGFDIQWNESNRSVYVTLNAAKAATPLKAEDNSKTPGTRAFDYVYTDITTYVNNKKVESYNIQGKTAIYFAALSEYGTMQWDGGNSHSKLYTLYKVSGKVSMYDNSSPSNVKITLKDKSNKVISSSTADLSGNYSFTNIPTGSYSVEFTLSGYKTQTTSANVNKSDVTGISTTLYREGVAISGKIYEYGVTNSNVLQGVTVNLRDSNGRVVTTVSSKNDGSYSFESIASGRYSVEAVKQGYKSVASSLFNVDYADITNKNLSMEYLGVTVSGTISSYETNNVLNGVTVNLKNSNSKTIATTTTSSNGTYSFTDVAQGTYTVEAVLTGYAPATSSSFTVANDNITAKNLSIRTSGYTLSGTIYANTTSSTTVSGATVKLRNTNGTEIQTVTSQYNGSYTFNAVASGTYIIEISATGYTTTNSSYFDVTANKTQHVYFNSTGTTITGIVSYYSSGSSITINNFQNTLYIDSNTIISGTITTGSQVTITYRLSGSYYYANSISSTNTSTVSGVVSSYSSGSVITINNYQNTYYIDSSTTTYGTIAVGSQVTITYRISGSYYYATSISSTGSSTGTISGTVSSYGQGSYITINNSQNTYYINTSTTTYGTIAVGSQVTITYSLSGSYYYATSISSTGAGNSQYTSAYGYVTNVNDYSITLVTSSMGSLTFQIYNISKPINLTAGGYATVYFNGYVTLNDTTYATATSISVH